MKLLNQSIKYLSLTVLMLLAIWSIAFYFTMFREIKDSADEELENQKRLILYNIQKKHTLTLKDQFDETQYIVQEVSREEALLATDQYVDTKVYMQDADDEQPELEPVRMLSTGFKFNTQYYRLLIINPIVEQDDLMRALLWNVIALYLLIATSILIVNGIVLKKLWQPFYKFLYPLRRYQIEKRKPVSTVPTQIDEFIYLQQAVGEMNRNSLNAFNQQKEFIENASHELQTPLAIASNKLELLFEEGELSDQQVEKLTESYQILQRLIKLNKSLLLLSKIENKQFLAVQTLSLNQLIQEGVAELQEYAQFKNIKIELFQKGVAELQMDRSLAQVLFTNLIRNAIFHNIENGQVEIYLTPESFKIRNTGKSHSLDVETMFNRFHRESKSSQSSGLGLAIVEAIVNLYHLQLNYSFSEEKHTFEISWS